MNAPPEPPGPGLCWERHEDFVEREIERMVAELDQCILEEDDAGMREMMVRLRPKAVAEIEQFARIALHGGTEH
jgi:hypothetical protein